MRASIAGLLLGASLAACSRIADPVQQPTALPALHQVIEEVHLEARAIPEPAPLPGPAGDAMDDEGHLIENLAAIAERYAVDTGRWEELYGKPQEQVDAVLLASDNLEFIPPEFRERAVYAYFHDRPEDAISLEWLDKNIAALERVLESPSGRHRLTCLYDRSWYVSHGHYWDCGRADGETFPQVGWGGVFLGPTIEQEDLEQLLRIRAEEQSRTEQWQALTISEYTVEILLAQQLREAFLQEFGEAPPVELELVETPMDSISVHRSGGEEVFSFFVAREEREAAEAAVAAALPAGFQYHLRGLGGFASTPPSVLGSSESALSAIIQTGAHEFAHHLFRDYPLGAYTSEEEKTLNETSAEVIGRDILSLVLPAYEHIWPSLRYDYLQYYVEYDTLRGLLLPEIRQGDDAGSVIARRYGAGELGRDIYRLRNCSGSLAAWWEFMRDNTTAADVEQDLQSCAMSSLAPGAFRAPEPQ